MNWEVEKFIACPDTGTIFNVVTSARNLRLILWSKSDYFLREGSVINNSPFGMAVNGKIRRLHILRTFPYSPSLWDIFTEKTQCPGNADPWLTCCGLHKKCMFSLCPYGAKPTPG